MMTTDNENPTNPFEKHIQSEAFDLSQLNIPGDPALLQEQLVFVINSLPHPLNYRLWDEELDDIQKQLCIHLSTLVIERYLRHAYADELRDISDDDLLIMLNVPLSLAMIVQQRLHIPYVQPDLPDISLRPAEPLPIPPDRPVIQSQTSPFQQVKAWLIQAGERLKRLINR